MFICHKQRTTSLIWFSICIERSVGLERCLIPRVFWAGRPGGWPGSWVMMMMPGEPLSQREVLGLFIWAPISLSLSFAYQLLAALYALPHVPGLLLSLWYIVHTHTHGFNSSERSGWVSADVSAQLSGRPSSGPLANIFVLSIKNNHFII